MTWPAWTQSPSRTVRPCSSPTTRALMTAEFTALSEPEIGRPWASSRVSARTTSVAASSTTVAAFCGAGSRHRLLLGLAGDSARSTPPPSSTSASASASHFQ